MMISVPVIGAVGERVVSYFGEFGKLDGWVSEHVEGDFLIDLALPREKRQQLAGKISWLEKQQKEAVHDARGQGRVIPENPHSTLIVADGSMLGCFVIDMSATAPPSRPTFSPRSAHRSRSARSVGRVIRHFREGFAGQVHPAGRAELSRRLVIRPNA